MKLISKYYLFYLPILIISCSSTQKITPIIGALMNTRYEVGSNSSAKLKESFSDSQLIEVIYATNRDRESAEVGKEMSFGTSMIHVPKLHSVGELDSIEDSKFNPDRYFRVISNFPLSLMELKTKVSAESDWGILIFVHGFNVDFKEALFRSAQIAYDLKFQGKIILMSWPAGENGSFIQKNLVYKTYEQNKKNAAESIESFSIFLKELSSLSVPIQLIVHSMGHQVIVPALEKVSSMIDHPFVQELIFNAPDLDPLDFEKASSSLKKISKRITIYCSPNDNALLASKAFNHKKRLGSCSLQDGVDVINVSEVDDPGLVGLGHGYYSSRPVLTDIYQVIIGMDASKRLFVRKSQPNSLENYILRK